MASNCTNGQPGSSAQTTNEPVAGILTRTFVRSPVVRWILHARIRERRHNDVVFVGDDFIQVMQVKEQGHLEHIATKTDLDARIRTAKVLSNDHDMMDGDQFMKFEYDATSDQRVSTPPQCIALTLNSNELLFVCLVSETTGGYHFDFQSCPLPVFDRLLLQPGEHLAIDPESRAVAVAANEREIVIYSTKSGDAIEAGFQGQRRNWCPIASQRPLQVDGVIIHMDFLIPSANDSDHIILLLIVVDRGKTKATWIDWYHGTDIHEAQIHPGQPVDDVKGVTSLLVPLRNTSFFLVRGTTVTKWDNILCGSPNGFNMDFDGEQTHIPGSSPRYPAWVNWCHPKRISDDMEQVYLVREDGLVSFVQVYNKGAVVSRAGEFGCHVGSAFASLGDDRDPDMLVVAGDMSTGEIQSIGHWSSPRRASDPSRESMMRMTLIEKLPNWASVTDMVTTSFSGKSQRPRDAVFVTSGRQSYGTITEIRKGAEARLSAYFPLDGLRSSTDIWALPLAAIGQVLLVVSSPSMTRFLRISTDAEMEDIEQLDEESLALDASHQTLAAAAITDGKLVQITTKSICVTPGTSANFEDSAKVNYAGSSAIIAVDIASTPSPPRSMALTAERSEDQKYALVMHELHTDDTKVSGNGQIKTKDIYKLASEPLGLHILPLPSTNISFVTDTDGNLSAYNIATDGKIEYLTKTELPRSPEGRSICDNIAVICHPSSADDSKIRHLVVCGLRDGRIYAIIFNTGYSPRFEDSRTINFSQSTVKLTQPSLSGRSNNRSIAYATSGLDFCLLSWDGSKVSSLSIESIWITDKSRPELAQGSVVACAHMPEASLLSSPDLAESLVMVSGDEFLVAALDRKSSLVPRQMPVSGTPNRLIYAEQQRCLVSASTRYDTRHFPSSHPHSKPEERRQIWPVIDFIPARSSEPSFTYEMQPGERVYALVEWSFQLGEEDKMYSFILVGGSYFKSNGSLRGRITFLQPLNKSWAVTDVKEGRTTNFEAPVYAIALLDELTYVACVGQTVVVYRFAVEDRKWTQICRPFKLASAGIYITISRPGEMKISTSQDSFVSLIVAVNHDDNEYPSRLVPICMAPRAENPLSHLVPTHTSQNGQVEEEDYTLMTTKSARITAMRTRSPETSAPRSAELLFEAQLPRSLTRLRQCNVRPRWKGSLGPMDGVLHDNIIGCAPDGSLIGVALLDRRLWRRLSWVQRLCEWSEELSPHSHRRPTYSVAEQSFARDERLMPIGLSASGGHEVVMRTSVSKLADGHIDGDILARLLEKGGEEALRRVIREVAERQDRAGQWMQEHIEEELEAVEGIVGVLRRVLDCWF